MSRVTEAVAQEVRIDWARSSSFWSLEEKGGGRDGRRIRLLEHMHTWFYACLHNLVAR